MWWNVSLDARTRGKVMSTSTRPPTVCGSASCVRIAKQSSSLGVVVECDTDSSAVVAIILSNDALAGKFPQSGVMVAAGSDEVCRICRECTVPYPALVAVEFVLQRQSS